MRGQVWTINPMLTVNFIKVDLCFWKIKFNKIRVIYFMGKSNCPYIYITYNMQSIFLFWNDLKIESIKKLGIHVGCPSTKEIHSFTKRIHSFTKRIHSSIYALRKHWLFESAKLVIAIKWYSKVCALEGIG